MRTKLIIFRQDAKGKSQYLRGLYGDNPEIALYIIITINAINKQSV
ncbi:hypothetical protein LYNGBM3L_06580 [Moorena producens 3L]|uniref:Uncharacterized protein n=1 Tax=Moorena producens 3L TaxID=489825 RepID=F4XJI9_9CYAN|nr:hypothetical protein LYNGBM3L_06580 [Moorena producens 3L]